KLVVIEPEVDIFLQKLVLIIGSGNLYCQWELSPGSGNALCILFPTNDSNARDKAVVNGNMRREGNPQQKEYKEKGVIDNGCSRGNKCYLIDFDAYDGGFVSFRDGKGRISSKGQIKTGKLDFDDLYFCKELNQVLLRVPRKDNIYSVDLKSVVPTGGLTCLFAKATLDESNLWHMRLGHINFKTMNKLVKGNLIRGLPSKIFQNDNSCVACQKGKQNKASYKAKLVNTISKPLHMLHMDLFGLTNVKSLMKKSYCLVVTDDFSRFAWVFFLATKGETSRILKTFITGIENQLDCKVKVIRCDNETEFKNSVMNQFCKDKGIKREISIARTPQQNKVTERRNRTLIEAARTMLVYSKLPTTFWAEAVNTHCYVLNRALVTKPHNKKPYEHIRGRPPLIDFMKPFGCPVTILNTRDNLDRFEGKADEDILLVVAGNQTNGIAGSKENLVAVTKDSAVDAGKKASEVDESEALDNGGKNDKVSRSEVEGLPQQARQTKNIKCTENFNTVGLPVNTVGSSFVNDASQTPINAVGPSTNDTGIFGNAYDDEVLKEKVDMNNVDSSYTIPEATRNKKDERGIVIKNKAILVAQGHTQEEGIDYDEVFAPVARIKAIWLFLAYASFKDFVVYQMDVKSAFLYGRIEDEVYVYQPLGFEDPTFQIKFTKWKRLSMDYIKPQEHVSRPDITFVVCACARFQVNPKTSHLHDVKRNFRYLKGQPKLGLWYPKDSPFDLEAYSDSDYTGASLNRKSTIEGCQFLSNRLISLQCKKRLSLPIPPLRYNMLLLLIVVDRIIQCKFTWISQSSGLTKLVADETVHKERGDIMERVATTTSSAASCNLILPSIKLELMVTVNAAQGLGRMSTMASAIICLADNQKFNFLKYIFDNMMKSLEGGVKFYLFLRFLQVFLDKQVEGIARHKEMYIISSYTKKIFANMRRIEAGFSGLITPLFDSMMVQATTDMGDTPVKIHQTPIIDQPSNSKPQKKQKPRRKQRKEAKAAQAKEIVALKKKFSKLNKWRKSRSRGLRKLKKISLGEINDDEIFGVNDLAREEVVMETTTGVKDNSAPTTDVTKDDITMAQALAALKSTKPKVVVQEQEMSTTIPATATIVTTVVPTPRAKGIVFHEQKQSKIPIVSSSKDKVKCKMSEHEVPIKKKDQMRINEEYARKLGVEEQEAARLRRAQQDEEANNSWDNVQVMMDADRLLAERLQAREREEFSEVQKARLLVELIEKRKKHFAALRAQEKRNKPSTKTQMKSQMYTYLKHMGGYKQSHLKGRIFDEIKELFDREMIKVNDFIAMDSKAQESSTKRTAKHLESNISKKQKVDENVKPVIDDSKELKKCMEIVPDDVYEAGLQSVEERLVFYKKIEDVLIDQINVLNLDVKLRDKVLAEYTKKLEKAKKEIDQLKLILEKLQNSSKSLNALLESQTQENQSDKGYHEVPPPTFFRELHAPKRDIRLIDEHFESESVDVSTVSLSDGKTVKTVDVKGVVSKEEPKPVKKNSFSPPIIEDWVSESEEENEPKFKKQVQPSFPKIEFVKAKDQNQSFRKPVKQVEQAKSNTHRPRGNQRN
nr:hypothetical protein [Tanacetum cinerariifolium]